MYSSCFARVFCLYYICILTKRISGFSFPCAFIFFTAHGIHWGCQHNGPKPRRWEQIVLPFARYLSCTYALEPSLHACLPAYEVTNVPSSVTTNDFKFNNCPGFILTVWNGIMTLEYSITANWALVLVMPLRASARTFIDNLIRIRKESSKCYGSWNLLQERKHNFQDISKWQRGLLDITI